MSFKIEDEYGANITIDNQVWRLGISMWYAGKDGQPEARVTVDVTCKNFLYEGEKAEFAVLTGMAAGLSRDVFSISYEILELILFIDHIETSKGYINSEHPVLGCMYKEIDKALNALIDYNAEYLFPKKR